MIRVNEFSGFEAEIGSDYIILDDVELLGIADMEAIHLEDDSDGAEIVAAKWKGIRKKRDLLLADSDKYMLIDFPITDTIRNQWKVYRQALRDITQQDINTITFPSIPIN